MAGKAICGLLVFLFITTSVSIGATQRETVRFAVIGDYGVESVSTAAVAELVKSWSPDFMITVGDNNYPTGSAETIDDNIGQYYHDYIAPYVGSYGEGALINRFFPTLGNHDWLTEDAQPYLDYFTLPGNERYYDFVVGDVHLFALDANYDEPDGFREDSVQADWLREHLAESTETWNIVYGHVPPYSSGANGSHPVMRWDFADMGADAVVSGHDHLYERLLIDGIPYFVNGTGGGGLYRLGTPVPDSIVRYNRNYGAMLVTADSTRLTFEFYTITGAIIDTYTLERE